MNPLRGVYATREHGHDEMQRTTGQLRRRWHGLLREAGTGDLAGRVAAVAESRRGHPTDRRSWRPDPLPLLLDEAEWQPLADAAAQRMELLDVLLTDLYGDRRLLTSGLLPPEVIAAHPGFLPPADGITLPGGRQLTLAAVDVARNADGTWVVLDDRCDAPGGLGSVVENRHVLAQTLGAAYRRSRVRRIGPFFRLLADRLRELAPASAGASPTLALLAPAGPRADQQGDAAIASQLGIRLVHAEDLVVHDDQLWTGSLGTPERIHVLLRRLRGSDSDPLELRAAGPGTPGLLHAARSGSVSIANPLGSGVLTTPALLCYLPRLARAVLGEELALPSVVTYWCGDRSMCSHVIANLGRLVLKPTRPGRSAAIRGWELSIGERAELSARIAARPGDWVGQEPIEVSTAPTMAAGELVAAPTGLRLFAAGTEEGYRLLPGGLGRVMHEEPAGGPVPEPGTVKDVWLTSSEAAPPPPAHGETAELSRRTEPAGLTPRVARDLFGLGFHAERAEGSVRLLRAAADVEQHDEATVSLLRAVVSDVVAPGSWAAAVTDPAVPGSVAADVAGLARAAAGAREQISGDTWPVLASLHRALAAPTTAGDPGSAAGPGTEPAAESGDGPPDSIPDPALLRLLEPLLALSAVVAEGTVRDLGWTLTMSGRRLARALGVTRALATGTTQRPTSETASAVDTALLVANESIITHRRRYHDAAALPGLLELLLWAPDNPRSLRFQLDELARLLPRVPVIAGGTQVRDQLLRDASDLLTELAGRDVLGHPDADGGHPQVAEALGSIGWRLAELRREIDRIHFAAPVAARFGEAAER